MAYPTETYLYDWQEGSRLGSLSYAFWELARFTTNKNDSTAQLYDISLCITLSGIRKKHAFGASTDSSQCMYETWSHARLQKTWRQLEKQSFITFIIYLNHVCVHNSVGEAICRSEALETLL